MVGKYKYNRCVYECIVSLSVDEKPDLIAKLTNSIRNT